MLANRSIVSCCGCENCLPRIESMETLRQSRSTAEEGKGRGKGMKKFSTYILLMRINQIIAQIKLLYSDTNVFIYLFIELHVALIYMLAKRISYSKYQHTLPIACVYPRRISGPYL